VIQPRYAPSEADQFSQLRVAAPTTDPQPVVTPRRKRRKGRIIALVLVLVLVALLAWPIGLLLWARGQINHIEALSGAPSTPGTTWLLAGNDERGSGGVEDATTGSRTDTILLLHQPVSGPTALISIPRDTAVTIPGRGLNRINAAYAFGGAPLLVQTVEQLTGLTIDHYIEIGFGGLVDVVDAIGGVELCSDLNVNDVMSGMIWTPGCHEVNGVEALAFSRMRFSDPLGDIGRADRQRQLISAIMRDLASPSLLFQPGSQVALIRSGFDSLAVSYGTGIVDFGRLALAFRAATGEGGVTGTPPISSLNYRPGGTNMSLVQLNPNTVGQFWEDLREGNLEPGVVNALPARSNG